MPCALSATAGPPVGKFNTATRSSVRQVLSSSNPQYFNIFALAQIACRIILLFFVRAEIAVFHYILLRHELPVLFFIKLFIFWAQIA